MQKRRRNRGREEMMAWMVSLLCFVLYFILLELLFLPSCTVKTVRCCRARLYAPVLISHVLNSPIYKRVPAFTLSIAFDKFYLSYYSNGPGHRRRWRSCWPFCCTYSPRAWCQCFTSRQARVCLFL